MFEKVEGKISLFERRDTDHEKAPDWKGTFLWKGEDLELALWKTVAKSGITYLSGKVGPKRQGRGPRID